ncbi:hypothetical protein DIE18_02380 [Burkholderia sp. Bp9125]|nr:hypothetical protein DIE18_02380 [Burkholderia sp. Bp9125]
MFEVTDNFALAIRLNHAHDNIKGKGDYRLYSSSKGFDAGYSLVGPGGESVEGSMTFTTEREVWNHFPAHVPWMLEELATSPHLYFRGLARRAELMRTLSEAEFEARMNDFERVPRQMWAALLTALAGMHLSKSTLMVRSKALKRGVGLWEMRARVGLAHYNEPVSMALHCFPSPVDNDAWLMRVQLPALSTDVVRSNQAAIRQAISNLELEGVHIEDVTQGTNLVLTL